MLGNPWLLWGRICRIACREIRILASDQEHGRTQGGFHDAARTTENRTSTRGQSQWVVEFCFFQGVAIDAEHLEHAVELAHGYHSVNVRSNLGGQLRNAAFVLLGNAGHDRHDKQALASLLGLFAEQVLRNRALHLMRRLRAGKLSHELRVMQLRKAHPTWAAARKHGARFVRAHELDELAPFLHDGEVGSEVGVVHVVETKGAQG